MGNARLEGFGVFQTKRRELAAKLGYARTTQGENAPWIKHINQVGPDRRLQAFFEGKVHLK